MVSLQHLRWAARPLRNRKENPTPEPSPLSLKRDQQGRITQRVVRVCGSPETRRYAYDSAGRLSRVTDERGNLCESYQYDHQGRRLAEINPQRFRGERRYTYLASNRLGQAGQAQYGHDKAGFRNLKLEGDAETHYRYEPSGLLLAVDLPDNVNGGRRIDYAYDENGLRTAKRVGGCVETAYLWLDPLRLGGFHDGSQWWRFLYDAQGRSPVGLENGREQYLLLCDQLGTPLALATTDGHVVQAMQYDSFGNPLRGLQGPVRLPLGFAGGLYDADTGLTRFPWRDYDADTGRFTALDPLGKKGGDRDWYGYCVDDPVNRVDVWGLESNSTDEDADDEGREDPAKEAGMHIVGSGIKGALWNAAKGYAAEGLAGAAARGVLGLGTGMLFGTVMEYPPVKEKVDQAITWFEDNYKPTDDGTMQD